MRHHSRTRRAGLVVGATVLVMAVIWAGHWVRSESARYAAADHLAITIEASGHRIDTVMWRLVSRIALGQATQLDIDLAADEIRNESDLLVEDFRALSELDVGTDRIADPLATYLTSIDRQLVHLDGGDLASLLQENDARTARAFADLDNQINGLLPLFEERASVGRLISNAGSVAVTALAALIAAVFVGWVRKIDAAERMVESKDRFIATVSHELRTPLTGVLGLSRVLTDASGVTLDPAEQQELMLEISRQAQEMGNLVEDLLVSARSEIDQLSVELEPTSLIDAVNEVGGSLAPLLHKTLHVVTSQDVQVAADPLRLRQIIRNLVMNAERHGGPSIVVRIEGEGQATSLVVADDGEPLAIRDRDRIFEPYEHSSRFTSGPTGSVGVGLAVSRELARKMGGDLTYRFRDGFAEFHLTFAPVAFLERSA